MPVKDAKDALAALRLDNALENKENLSDDVLLEYPIVGDQREVPSPRRKKGLSKQDTIKQLFSELTQPEQKALVSELGDTVAGSELEPQRGVPQWADRKKLGIKLKAEEWVKTYYGNRSGGAGWEAQGLKKSDLRALDFKLYEAYIAYLKRLKKNNRSIPDDLQCLEETPTQRVSKELSDAGINTPYEALEKFKNDPLKAQRLYQAAYRRT